MLTLQLPNINLEDATAQSIKALAIVTDNVFNGNMHNVHQRNQMYDLLGVAQLEETDPIKLSVNASLYFLDETIRVTLSNESNQVIFFQDHQTDCTVVQLQRQVD